MRLLLSACTVASAYRPAYVPTSRLLSSPTRAGSLRLSADPEPPQERLPALPFLQQGVPEDQQPVVELRNLRARPFYDWADTDDGYRGKLLNLYANTMLFLSLPISYTTFNVIPDEVPQMLLAANIGTLGMAMLPFVLRLRVGWGFVSKRLREKASYYEAQQTGLFSLKDPEARLRDRLIQQSQVAPIVRRIDVSIASLAAALVLSLGAGEALTAIEGEAGPSTLKTLVGDNAIQFNNRLRADDEFAAREQTRAQRKAETGGIKPTYCDSRYFKILAGGNGQGGVGCD